MVLNDVTTKNCLGKVLKTKFNGDLKVIGVINNKLIEVEFLGTGYKTNTDIGNLRKGVVKDKLIPSIFNYGIVGEKYKSRVNGILLKEYRYWHSMIERCYSSKLHDGINKVYKDCTTSKNFKRYEYFYEWCQSQTGFGVEGFELDKDLLIKGNKIYSEDACVFLPKEINTALVKSTASRGTSLIGTTLNKRLGKYVSQINKFNDKKHLGVFDTEIEAFNAYKLAKESYLKELANKWKSQIDIRAYNALMNYEVNITD